MWCRQATVRYSVRALKAADMRDLVERVRKIAEGAALMTDTQVRSTVVTAMSEMLDNPAAISLVARQHGAAGTAGF